jgi:PmbA protein
MFVPNILAINFHKHTSAYEGKINELVTSTNINLIDDGTDEDGIHTSLFDAEGVPRRRTPIIERGILRTPLYDNCSSKRYDVESTGNASRGGYGLPDFATPPFIQPSNLIIELSNESNGDLLPFVGNGVLFTGVLTGMGHSNFTTGEFIITSSNAFQIKNGELKKPLKPCSCRGNFHTMIKNITAVDKDMKNFGMVICPSIAVKELSLST